MTAPLTPSPADLSRRHLLCGALGTVAVPFATPALAAAEDDPEQPDDAGFMRLAIEEAAQGDFPFGAVITHDGAILAQGRNLGIQEKDPTAHAEMVAIRRCLAAHGPEKLKGTTIYASGEPCPMCMGAIIWCGMGRVVYAASIEQLSSRIGQIMVTHRELAARTPFETVRTTGGVLAAESLKLFG
jgi:tRNA(adenine34) deaminase